MPIMDVSEMRDARKNKWLLALGGGIGFEGWQIAIWVMVALAITLASLILGQLVIGTAIGIALGWLAAMLPNYMNTHHQESRDYLEGQVRKRVQKTLVINGKRVAEPSDLRERFYVAIAEFPDTDNGDTHVP